MMLATSRARLKRNSLLLKKLCRTKNKTKLKSVLREGGEDLMSCICECALNLIKGNVPVTSNQFTRLKKHKRTLRVLSDKKLSKKKKKHIVNQKGAGLFPLIFTPIIKALAGSIL